MMEIRTGPPGAMNTPFEYRQAGFDIYSFSNAASRTRYREDLKGSGVDFEVHEMEEIIVGFRLYSLAIKRTSPTFKQRILGAK